MNDQIITFTPDSNDAFFLWLGIVIAIVAFAVSYYLLMKPKSKATGLPSPKTEPARPPRKAAGQALIAMLFFFAGLMAASTAFFSGWNIRKQGEVSLQTNEIIIGVHQIPYTAIKELFIRKDQQSSAFGMPNQEEAARILIIEKNDGQTFALSSKQYPLPELYGRLKEILKNRD